MKSVWAVLAVFIFMPVWWALFNQNGSEWTLQARALDLHTDLRFWIFQWDFLNFTVEPEAVQAINAVEILLFIPLFTNIIYPFIERLGIKVTPLRKVAAGFVVTAITFCIVAFIQIKIDRGERPDVMWQYLAYTVLTVAEVLVSVTMLEYAYTQAPPSMKSTIIAFWHATVAVGSILVSFMNGNIKNGGFFSRFQGSDYYWFFTGVMLVTTLVFMFASGKIKEKNYLVNEATK